MSINLTSRLTASVDAASAALVSLAHALVLAGPLALPVTSARALHGLARGARAALLASEPGVALALLDEMDAVLAGDETEYAQALTRKTADLRRAVTWRPRATPTP